VEAQRSADDVVPLRVVLKMRDELNNLKTGLSAREQELASLRSYKDEAERILDEVRTVYPSVREKAVKASQYETELEREKKRVALMREKLTTVREKYGDEFGFDEAAFERDARLEAALSAIENIDTRITAALASQLDSREARYTNAERDRADKQRARDAQAARDNFFNAQIAELEKVAPGIKRYGRALRAEFEADPSVPLADVAAPLVESLAMRVAASRAAAQRMPTSTGATAPPARPAAATVGGASPDGAAYKGKSLREIIAMRKQALGVA
jgi:chromosome segregation ATPase